MKEIVLDTETTGISEIGISFTIDFPFSVDMRTMDFD